MNILIIRKKVFYALVVCLLVAVSLLLGMGFGDWGRNTTVPTPKDPYTTLGPDTSNEYLAQKDRQNTEKIEYLFERLEALENKVSAMNQKDLVAEATTFHKKIVPICEGNTQELAVDVIKGFGFNETYTAKCLPGEKSNEQYYYLEISTNDNFGYKFNIYEEGVQEALDHDGPDKLGAIGTLIRRSKNVDIYLEELYFMLTQDETINLDDINTARLRLIKKVTLTTGEQIEISTIAAFSYPGASLFEKYAFNCYDAAVRCLDFNKYEDAINEELAIYIKENIQNIIAYTPDLSNKIELLEKMSLKL